MLALVSEAGGWKQIVSSLSGEGMHVFVKMHVFVNV